MVAHYNRMLRSQRTLEKTNLTTDSSGTKDSQTTDSATLYGTGRFLRSSASC